MKSLRTLPHLVKSGMSSQAGNHAFSSETSFHEQGIFYPVKVLSDEEVQHYRRKYTEYVKFYGSEQSESHRVKGISDSKLRRRIRGNKIFRLHVVARWAADLVRHPNLIAAVSQALGSENLLIWSSDLTVKSADSTECFGWHQDEAYADLGPHNKLLTAWVALTDTTEENGCVRYVPGTSVAGTLSHVSKQRTSDCNLVLGQVLADDELVKTLEARSIMCKLKAGEASLHAWRTVHSSSPNKSDHDRIGLAVRFMTADVRPSQPVVRERVSLASGYFDGDWFELEPEPSTDYGKDEWTQHKISMDREWERRKRSKELGLLPSQKFSRSSQ